MPEEFDEKILVSFRNNLSKYGQPYNKELAPKFSAKEERTFNKNHQIVSSLVDENGLVEIVELTTSGDAKKVFLEESEINNELVKSLKEFFH